MISWTVRFLVRSVTCVTGFYATVTTHRTACLATSSGYPLPATLRTTFHVYLPVRSSRRSHLHFCRLFCSTFWIAFPFTRLPLSFSSRYWFAPHHTPLSHTPACRTRLHYVCVTSFHTHPAHCPHGLLYTIAVPHVRAARRLPAYNVSPALAVPTRSLRGSRAAARSRGSRTFCRFIMRSRGCAVWIDTPPPLDLLSSCLVRTWFCWFTAHACASRTACLLPRFLFLSYLPPYLHTHHAFLCLRHYSYTLLPSATLRICAHTIAGSLPPPHIAAPHHCDAYLLRCLRSVFCLWLGYASQPGLFYCPLPAPAFAFYTCLSTHTTYLRCTHTHTRYCTPLHARLPGFARRTPGSTRTRYLLLPRLHLHAILHVSRARSRTYATTAPAACALRLRTCIRSTFRLPHLRCGLRVPLHLCRTIRWIPGSTSAVTACYRSADSFGWFRITRGFAFAWMPLFITFGLSPVCWIWFTCYGSLTAPRSHDYFPIVTLPFDLL